MLNVPTKVRAVAAVSSDILCSGSRDTKVVEWRRVSNLNSQSAFTLAVSRAFHAHFVQALAVLPPSQSHPNGLIASGSADKSINVFAPGSQDHEPLFTLLGHSDTVCALDVDEVTGALVSGSWDKTAKVWIDWQCVTTLQGHEQAVWAVLFRGDYVITASADKTIKVWDWKTNQCTRTLHGHTDAVRALCALPGIGFASGSNDGTVRVWSKETGDCLADLHSHTSFIYGLSSFTDGTSGFVSCGEDRTVKVWRRDEASSNPGEFNCAQTIPHPCTSVWCVSTLPNGDIVSGGSDAAVRVFTTSEDRAAPSDAVKAYDDAVAKHQIPSNQVGDVDKTKLPGLERLAVPGTPDQVVMIRSGDLVEAHQFNATEGTWMKIGEVVDAVSGGRKQMHQGREYDYVFDIDIGAGPGANLKLPYNLSENPFMAAQDFINRHELNQDFLDQIGNFIINNSKGASLGTDTNSQFSDPFTGAGRYVPGGAHSIAAPPAAVKAVDLFPGVFAIFGSINGKGVKTKIIHLNADVSKLNDLVLNTEELGALSSLVEIIEAGRKKVGASLDARVWAVLSKVAFQWPESLRFPGIDLIRICVLYSPMPVSLEGDGLISKLLHAAGLTSAFEKVENDVNKMLALRAITNLVGTPEGIDALYKARQMVINTLGYKWSLTSNVNLRLAIASVYLNLVIVLGQKDDDSFSFDLLTSLIEFISSEHDVENEYRALVALGTLLRHSKSAQEASSLVDLKSVLKMSKNKSLEKIATLHRAILKK
ncbi:WD40-repeat-containing domain protein [Chytriomyces sp. MP71]|nr:WD40-repeat-containing domain protein [Chytriomyces sp. MP71]